MKSLLPGLVFFSFGSFVIRFEFGVHASVTYLASSLDNFFFSFCGNFDSPEKEVSKKNPKKNNVYLSCIFFSRFIPILTQDSVSIALMGGRFGKWEQPFSYNSFFFFFFFWLFHFVSPVLALHDLYRFLSTEILNISVLLFKLEDAQ